MNQTVKRGLALLMAFVLCIGLMPAIELTANAANVDYRYSGSYIYNWGTRKEEATFLSPNAEKFYQDNSVTYDELAALAGSSNTSSTPSSALYKKLQNLMASNQTYQTSYKATRDLFQYTDCEKNGSPATISSFYSGTAIGPGCDSGSTCNREHCWPNSKSNGGSNNNSKRETDIMMLRPTAKSENGSRRNTA